MIVHLIHVEDAIDQQLNGIHGPKLNRLSVNQYFRKKRILFVDIFSILLLNENVRDVLVVLYENKND